MLHSDINTEIGDGDGEQYVPESSDDDNEEEEDGLPKDPDNRRTSVLTKEAAASAGLAKKRTTRDDNLEIPKRKVSKKAATAVVDCPTQL